MVRPESKDLFVKVLGEIFEIEGNPEKTNGDEISNVQSQRGKVYGNYIVNATAREDILRILKDVFQDKNGKISMPIGFETTLGDIVAKLVRLAASPTHEDSVLDLQSYANLWLKIIRNKEKK